MSLFLTFNIYGFLTLSVFPFIGIYNQTKTLVYSFEFRITLDCMRKLNRLQIENIEIISYENLVFYFRKWFLNLFYIIQTIIASRGIKIVQYIIVGVSNIQYPPLYWFVIVCKMMDNIYHDNLLIRCLVKCFACNISCKKFTQAYCDLTVCDGVISLSRIRPH